MKGAKVGLERIKKVLLRDKTGAQEDLVAGAAGVFQHAGHLQQLPRRHLRPGAGISYVERHVRKFITARFSFSFAAGRSYSGNAAASFARRASRRAR